MQVIPSFELHTIIFLMYTKARAKTISYCANDILLKSHHDLHRSYLFPKQSYTVFEMRMTTQKILNRYGATKLKLPIYSSSYHSNLSLILVARKSLYFKLGGRKV